MVPGDVMISHATQAGVFLPYVVDMVLRTWMEGSLHALMTSFETHHSCRRPSMSMRGDTMSDQSAACLSSLPYPCRSVPTSEREWGRSSLASLRPEPLPHTSTRESECRSLCVRLSASVSLALSHSASSLTHSLSVSVSRPPALWRSYSCLSVCVPLSVSLYHQSLSLSVSLSSLRSPSLLSA